MSDDMTVEDVTMVREVRVELLSTEMLDNLMAHHRLSCVDHPVVGWSVELGAFLAPSSDGSMVHTSSADATHRLVAFTVQVAHP